MFLKNEIDYLEKFKKSDNKNFDTLKHLKK